MIDMELRYTISIIHNKTQTKHTIIANISNNEWTSLTNFENYTQDLLKANFLRKDYSYSASFEDTLSYEVKELPTDEELAYFLHKFRPFYLQKEPTNFLRICKIINKNFRDIWIQLLIDEQMKNFTNTMTSSLWKIETADNIVLNSEKMLDKWLNGFEYHKDNEKRLYVEKLHDDFFPLDFNKILFYSMLKDKTRAIRNIANMIKKMKRKYNIIRKRYITL